MPVDEYDSAAATEELPPLVAVVFCARARPVVMSDVERALIDDANETPAHREWLRATDRGDVRADGEGPVAGPDDRRSSFVSLIAHGAVVVVLTIPAMLIVAFGMAVAAR